MPTFLLGLLAISVVSAEAALQCGPGGPGPQPGEAELAAVRRLLQDARARPETILALAEKALANADTSPQQLAEAHFLLGLAEVRMAERSPSEKAQDLRSRAVTNLDKADTLGVAEQDQPRLCYTLGRALFQTNGDPQRAITYLERSLTQGAETPTDAHGVLAQLYLRLQPPDVENALKHNQLDLSRTQEDKARAAGWLERGELLARKGVYLEALKALERVDARASPEVRLQARLLKVRCCEEEGLWARAVPVWKELMTTPDKVPGGLGRVLYKLGLCYSNSEPPDLETAAKAWQDACDIGGEDGQAAGLMLAGVRLAKSPPDVQAALGDLRRSLARTNNPDDYHNSLVNLTRARELFEQALKAARDARDFGCTAQLSQLYRKLAQPGVAAVRFAEAAEAWAGELRDKAKQSGPQAATQAEQARAQYRAAGEAYEGAAAPLPAGEQRGDYLWRGATCYRQGQDDAKAVVLLERLVEMPPPPDKQAEGWYTLGEVRWALQRKDDARQAYYKCIEFPAGPFPYRARYQLARDKFEQDQLKEAEEILRQNLGFSGLALDREAHEKTLYLLGAVLFQQGKYTEAGVKLKEASSQYPDNPEVLRARFRLGECYRQEAVAESAKLKSTDGPVNAEAQAHYRKLQKDWLNQALVVYQKLADDLEARALEKEPSLFEEQVLRRSVLALADLHFDLSNFLEALRDYGKVVERYDKHVESLYACLGIWRCCVVMVEPGQSRMALEAIRVAIQHAKENLPQIPDAAFQGPQGTWRRAEWDHWVNDVIEQLQRQPMETRLPGS